MESAPNSFLSDLLQFNNLMQRLGSGVANLGATLVSKDLGPMINNPDEQTITLLEGVVSRLKTYEGIGWAGINPEDRKALDDGIIEAEIYLATFKKNIE